MSEPWQTAEAVAYSHLLAESFARLTGRPLVVAAPDDLPFALYHLATPIVSHGTEADPVFRYANKAALALWEMDWPTFTALPSRRSAEAERGIQADRDRLLAEAREKGWTDGYRGIRISASGRRFRILDTLLWTVTDGSGLCHGQAARIGRVEML